VSLIDDYPYELSYLLNIRKNQLTPTMQAPVVLTHLERSKERTEQGCHNGDAAPSDDHVADQCLVVWVADDGADLGKATMDLAPVGHTGTP
jgi:hypothetical protein